MESQLARWKETLGKFEFNIKHRPGRLHRNSDALSRISCQHDCQFCNRINFKHKRATECIKGRTALIRTRQQVKDKSQCEREILDVKEVDPVMNKFKHWKEKPPWETVSGESQDA